MICKNFRGSAGSQFLNQSTITLLDKGSRVTARFENLNHKRVLKIKLDGEYFVQTSSCDYMIVVCDEDRCWLVELKGSNLNKAYRQILNSLELLLDKILTACELIAVAVVTRVAQPDYRSPEYLKLKRKLDAQFLHNRIIVIGQQFNTII